MALQWWNGALRRAIELGAFLIDTAEVYGTEEAVGQAIEGIRDRVFVATKVSGAHLRYDDVLHAAEDSLRRLNADHIDLYQIHWPNSAVPIRETTRAMEALVDRGVIKYVGVSNFTLDGLREAQAAMNNYPIVSNQVLYNLNRRHIEEQLLPYCQTHQITIIAYTPLDNGRLARRSEYPSNPDGARAMEAVATEAQKTLAQVALNWCTARPNVIVIPKSNSEARVTENCAASGWRLSPEQIQLLDTAFTPEE